MMNYAEASYFQGYHYQHIADRLEAARLARKLKEAQIAYNRHMVIQERRTGSRSIHV